MKETSGIAAFAAMAALGALLSSAPASAQRGQDFVRSNPAAPIPSNGFPGVFDTAVVRRGGIVATLPALGIDFGVTERITVGTNLWSFVPIFREGAPSGLAKIRCRFHSSRDWATAATLYVGGMSWDGEKVLGALGTSNTTWFLGRRTAATLTLAALRLSTPQVDEQAGAQDITLTAGGIGATFEHFFNPWLGFQATAAVAPLVAQAQEDANANIRSMLDLGNGLLDRSMVRLLVEAQPGRWLLSTGGVFLLGPTLLLPFTEVAWRW